MRGAPSKPLIVWGEPIMRIIKDREGRVKLNRLSNKLRAALEYL